MSRIDARQQAERQCCNTNQNKNISGFKNLVKEIHKKSDTKVFIQIGDHLPGMVNVDEVPVQFIDAFVSDFKKAAVRVKKAGFDGIEIHSAHSYFLASFLSLRNKRKDEYGKNFKGRMKLLKRVVSGVKDGIPRKPDPAGAINIAKEMSLPVDKFIYTGDTNTDMKTATGAGMFPVGVLWGFRDEHELRESGAKEIIKRPQELLDLI